MKTSKVTIALAAALFLIGMPDTQAQENGKGHELSVSLQGIGIGSMPFRGSASWEDQPGLSLGFNAGYSYWFAEHFGFRTGVRLSRFSHNQKISNLSLPITASMAQSSLGYPGGSAVTTVMLRGSATTIQEEQSYTFLELPLQIAMRFGGLFANVGLSLSKAVNATADYSITDPALVVTSLPDLGVTPTTPVPMTLSGTTERSVKNADMSKPFYCLLAAEAGYNFPIGDATSLALGVFGRYAPIAHKTDNDVDIYALSPKATYSVTQPSTSAQVEKMGYYEVGVSLGLNFALGRKQPKAPADQAATLQPADNQAMTQMASELAAMKAAQKKAADELASVKAAQKKAEDELAAVKAAQKKAESEQAATRNAQQQPTQNMQNMQPASQGSQTSRGAQTYVQTDEEGITVYFDFNSRRPLTDEATEAKLRNLCSAMQADTTIHVVVTGYADNVGTKRNNRKIGYKRANAVKRKMVEWGAPAQNIKCESKGEAYPADSNASKEGRAQNRRATVKSE